jgi:hypothetical protein
MFRPSDTSAAAWDVQTRILRAMEPAERFALVRDLTIAAQELAFSELRTRHPEASDDDLWLKLAARRLGVDVVRRVYGCEIEPS